MPPAQQGSSLAGSFRLFRVAGISVFVHWSWLLVAYYELRIRANDYTSQVWNVAEYLSLFLIVLLHEFGHALACRQVGGRANEIVLWPLGGIAFVSPPPRPGALLWTIAAGPLVNAVLVPVTIGAWIVAGSQRLHETNPDADHFLFALMAMNLILLIFNMLPIYPLDGGQFLQALLWFIVGRAQSLLVVSIIGMVVGLGVIGLAVWAADVWIGILAVFVALRAWAGFQQAQSLARMAQLPRHPDAACPACHVHPLIGEFWTCNACGTRFDTFRHQATCPGCGAQFPETACPECHLAYPIADWFNAAQPPEDRWRTDDPEA